jgi:hypothetical protein
MKTKLIYYNQNTQQVSGDKQVWVAIKGHNEFQTPYYVLNDKEDWCSIKTSVNGQWLICFLKEQSSLDQPSQCYKDIVKISDIFDPNCVIFSCYPVIKNETTGQWERAKETNGVV